MNIKLTIAYNGEKFSGYQIQNKKLKIDPTIQNELEKSMKKIYKKKLKLYAASRTDRGVHAKGQVISFNPPFHIKPNNLQIAFNMNLPTSIRVLNTEEVSDDFNARKDAKSKIYIYKIHNSKISSPFDFSFLSFIHVPLDIEKMRRCSKLFLGEHDFTAYTTSQEKRKNKITRIYAIKIIKHYDKIYICIHGRNFFHKMVRFIAGVLIEVGKNKWTIDDVKYSLAYKKRPKQVKVALSKGLFLKRVLY
jgi:tRNA pseudouridine38-40 synthase